MSQRSNRVSLAGRSRRADPISARPRTVTARVHHPTVPGLDERVEKVFDPILHMRKSKQLEERQYRAAEMYRSAWDVLYGSIGGAMDYDRVRGAGLPGAPPGQPYLSACEKISEARRHLYAMHHRIVQLIVGEGRTIDETARLIHGAAVTREEKRRTGDRLRDALSQLADKWNPTGQSDGGRMRTWRTAEPSADAVESTECIPARVAHASGRGVKMSGEGT